MASNQRRLLALPLFLGLIGVLFSAWHLWGDSSILCVTEGCSLFQHFEVAGLSIWWLGLAGCALLALVAIPGLAGLGLFLAGAGLTLDIILLAIMLTTAPCFSCLLIGGLLALLFIVYRNASREERKLRPPYGTSWLLLCWLLLFLLNMGSLANSQVGPKALPTVAIGPKNAAIHIYFSPSCPACKDLVAATANGEMDQSIAWYAVEEEERDTWVINNMTQRMAAGASLHEALTAAQDETPLYMPIGQTLTPSMFITQYTSWRNKAHVLKSGSTRLPYVEMRGAPSFLMQKEEAPRPAATSQPSGSSFGNYNRRPPVALGASTNPLDIDAFCDGSDGEPCEEQLPTEGTPSLRDIMTPPAP